MKPRLRLPGERPLPLEIPALQAELDDRGNVLLALPEIAPRKLTLCPYDWGLLRLFLNRAAA